MNNTKKVIILVIAVIAAIAVFVAGFIIIGNYINKKPERLAQSFKNKIIGTWTSDYDISELSFYKDDTAGLNILGISVSGTYPVAYEKETEQYNISLTYNSDIGISVSREFTNVKLDEINNTLTLTDKNSNVNIVLKRETAENNTSSVSSTENNDSGKNTGTSDPNLQKKLLGKWNNSNDNGGYVFYEDGTADVSLSSFNTKGTYTVSKDDDGKTRLKVSYKTAIGMTISNSYYAQIENDVLELSQVGAENIILKYTRG